MPGRQFFQGRDEGRWGVDSTGPARGTRYATHMAAPSTRRPFPGASPGPTPGGAILPGATGAAIPPFAISTERAQRASEGISSPPRRRARRAGRHRARPWDLSTSRCSAALGMTRRGKTPSRARSRTRSRKPTPARARTAAGTWTETDSVTEAVSVSVAVSSAVSVSASLAAGREAVAPSTASDPPAIPRGRNTTASTPRECTRPRERTDTDTNTGTDTDPAAGSVTDPVSDTVTGTVTDPDTASQMNRVRVRDRFRDRDPGRLRWKGEPDSLTPESQGCRHSPGHGHGHRHGRGPGHSRFRRALPDGCLPFVHAPPPAS